MQISYYIPLILLLFILLLMWRNQRIITVKRLIQKRRQEDDIEMIELAKRFVGKECIIYSFNSNQFTGIIKEVSDGAVLIENNGTAEVINLDFVVRIREYPKNKKGKKKSIVID